MIIPWSPRSWVTATLPLRHSSVPAFLPLKMGPGSPTPSKISGPDGGSRGHLCVGLSSELLRTWDHELACSFPGPGHLGHCRLLFILLLQVLQDEVVKVLQQPALA